MNAASKITALLGIAPADLPFGLRAWDGSTAGAPDGPCVVLRRRRALRHLLWSPGELGLARAYVTGDLDVEGDLTEALRRGWTLVGTVKPRLGQVPLALRLGAFGLRPPVPEAEARLSGRLHSRSRDRAAISHHYDFGNDFYEKLLAPTMGYSCGYWTGPDATHDESQLAKFDLICEKLQLRPGMKLLDVGCGWGALVLHAARKYGATVHGITLAAEQAKFVRDRVAAEGLEDRVTVEQRDYRELPASASYDAVSSIEMGEHVGEVNYPQYVSILAGALKPGGALLLQQMSRGRFSPGGGKFIESYIAPDMTMRPLPATLTHLETAGFEVQGVQSMREDYVRTIRAWADILEDRWSEFVALTNEEYARVWRLYMVGGALAFEENRMGVHQILATVSPATTGGAPDRRPVTSAKRAAGAVSTRS